jgi:2-polyprenyl-3-methyl-5-hydroxy-6-metoxy-1,4-benzoquinol methylase
VNDSYDGIASYYNRYWGNLSRKISKALKVKVLESLSPNARILDLCCGTGNLVSYLSNKGYDVTGIDRSEQMIMHAKANNSLKANFIIGDIEHILETTHCMTVLFRPRKVLTK